MVRNKLFHVPIKRNISFKTEPLMGTIVPQVNKKEPIFQSRNNVRKEQTFLYKKRNVINWEPKFLVSA